MIHVIFLAHLREQLGMPAMDISITNIATVGQLKKHLVSKNPAWEGLLLNSKILAAVNHTYAKDDHELVDGDEVAFFPPVTGG